MQLLAAHGRKPPCCGSQGRSSDGRRSGCSWRRSRRFNYVRVDRESGCHNKRPPPQSRQRQWQRQEVSSARVEFDAQTGRGRKTSRKEKESKTTAHSEMISFPLLASSCRRGADGRGVHIILGGRKQQGDHGMPCMSRGICRTDDVNGTAFESRRAVMRTTRSQQASLKLRPRDGGPILPCPKMAT